MSFCLVWISCDVLFLGCDVLFLGFFFEET